MFNQPLPPAQRASARRAPRAAAAAAAALLALAHTAWARPVLNGSFEFASKQDSFSIGRDATLSNWSVAPAPSGKRVLDCLVAAGDTTGLCGNAFGGGMTFWVNPGASPDGGNYVAIDGDSGYSNPLTQVVDGLVAGPQYDIRFYQAAAQQSGFTGATTERWQLSLGTEQQLSALMNNANHGAVPWMAQSLRFTATANSELLQFVAKGTPNGQPPFMLLDGVAIADVSGVPEPGTLALVGLGLLTVPAARRFARKLG